jgi:hypothetical protein
MQIQQPKVIIVIKGHLHSVSQKEDRLRTNIFKKMLSWTRCIMQRMRGQSPKQRCNGGKSPGVATTILKHSMIKIKWGNFLALTHFKMK